MAYALRLAKSGTPVADACRQIGIAEATLYLWKKKYGGLGVSEMRELRQMREENTRLKRLVADLTLDKQILHEVIRKKNLTPVRRRELAQWIQGRYQVSCRRACALGDICPNTWYYRSQARDASALRMRSLELAQARPRFGYTRIWILLRRERLARQQEARPPPVSLGGAANAAAHAPQEAVESAPRCRAAGGWPESVLEMDFVHGQIVTGRAFRVLTVIDQWSRESVLLEANVALTGQSVVDSLEAVRHRPLPKRSPTITAGSHVESPRRVGVPTRRRVGLHSARKARGECVYRELQRSPARRMSQRL